MREECAFLGGAAAAHFGFVNTFDQVEKAREMGGDNDEEREVDAGVKNSAKAARSPHVM